MLSDEGAEELGRIGALLTGHLMDSDPYLFMPDPDRYPPHAKALGCSYVLVRETSGKREAAVPHVPPGTDCTRLGSQWCWCRDEVNDGKPGSQKEFSFTRSWVARVCLAAHRVSDK